MGKKRKASSQQTVPPKDAEREKARLAFHGWEDIPDSEDEYLLKREKILLDEGPETKRRRKVEQQQAALELSDEEVLKLPDSEDEDDDDYLDPKYYASSKGNGVDISDEEEAANGRNEEDEDEYGGWGKDEYYGGDVIESDAAAEDEEKEARRLQQKHLAKMSDADFGLDDWVGLGDDDDGVEEQAHGVINEKVAEPQITDDTPVDERMLLFRARYPEFEPIANEFLELQALYPEIESNAHRVSELESMEVGSRMKNKRKHPAVIRWQALSAHLGAMAMYFTVLTSTATPDGTALALPPLELREHPVVETLLETRQLWQRANALEIPDFEDGIALAEEPLTNPPQMDETLAGPDLETTDVLVKEPVPKTLGTTKKQKAAELAAIEAKARRAQRELELEKDLAALDSLTAKASLKSSKNAMRKSAPTATENNDSDFGDETELTAKEAAEKARRKKSLGFYTSQIAQKASKRGVAGRDAGGDMDIPHRERLRERQARLREQVEKRGSKALKPTEVAVDSDDREDERPPAAARGEGRSTKGVAGSDSEDYYDMVASRAQQKRADKKAQVDAYKRAEAGSTRAGEDESIGADQKRKLSYAIEKNKGLTQSKKKTINNPRVKQKMKFEKKKKKLASQKASYKGGEGAGGYGGELSGIKTSVVKSVKF